MKLVLDTNVIHGDFLLHGPRITKLCSAAPSLGYEVLIPEVVCDEKIIIISIKLQIISQIVTNML